MSREKQDDWKRTQIRMPQDQYDDVVKYAEQNNLSLNSAMLELIEKGLDRERTNSLVSRIAHNVHPPLHGLKKMAELQDKEKQRSEFIVEFLKYFEEKGYELQKKNSD